MSYKELKDMALYMEEGAKDLLDFWIRFAPNPNDDSFYGLVDKDLIARPDANKHLVLSTRLIWTFSAAYRIFEDVKYEEMAHRAYDYYMAYFKDRENGGAYWELYSDERAFDDSKKTYGLSFAIYGLSEYYRVFKKQEALDEAIEIYEYLEKYAYDNENKGYYEVMTADWKLDIVDQTSNINPYASACKTMNTHLHLLESYTNLYRVWDDEGLLNKLKEHIEVMIEHIVDNDSWHYKLYFDEKWNSITADISYGHDIEGSWLLWEAAEIANDKALMDKVKEVSINMAKAVYDKSWHPDGGIIYETQEDGRVLSNRSWWVQAEALVGFYNAWELTDDKIYLEAVETLMDFIDRELVDKENGGWYSNAISDNVLVNRIDGWKCPYHDFRMYMEILERIDRK